MSKETIITEEELKKIRKYTRKDMNKDELYTFSLILCDNEIDRDGEKFTTQALTKLAELFVGKTGIFDHNMSSHGQTARIYETEISQDDSRKTKDGEIYTCVRAKAYMVRTDNNKDLISEIDAGIKKETSVGCSVKSVKCSICGKDIRHEGCEHRKGHIYAGKTCNWLLCEPEDAYEWSFVAVPSQRNAGVVKAYNTAKNDELYTWADEFRQELKAEIIKSASRVMPLTESSLIGEICDSITLKNLRDFKNSLGNEVSKNLPLVRQLDTPAEKDEKTNNDYMI